VTTLLTNTLLVMVKLMRHLTTTRRSLAETMGISSVLQLPMSFNVVDSGRGGGVDEEAPKAAKPALR
jgi:hypothetical protein